MWGMLTSGVWGGGGVTVIMVGGAFLPRGSCFFEGHINSSEEFPCPPLSQLFFSCKVCLLVKFKDGCGSS